MRAPIAAAKWGLILLTLAMCHPAAGAVNVALVPVSTPVLVGDTLRLRLVLTADSAQVETFASLRVILNWDPAQLRLLGNDGTGAVSLLTSGFPNDPFNLNESTLPQDGTALYVGFAPLGNPVSVDQEGTLVTTVLFEAIAPVLAQVNVPATGGLPATRTTVFDGRIPNLDITGSISGAVAAIVAEPTRMILSAAPSSVAPAGTTATVTLSMENLNGQFAAGFQAFLQFDPAEVTFVSGQYTPAPFGAPSITPITASAGMIDLAAGIDAPGGQFATTDDATLATLTFQRVDAGCVSSVAFRPATPGSRLTDATGAPLGLVTLVDPTPPDPALCACPCELDGSAGIDVFDLLAYLDLWFVADPGAERTGDEPAQIDVFDLLAYLDCWFAPPPGCQ